MRIMMSVQARRELLAEVGPRYRNVDKKQKHTILNEFVAATGYQRKYAIALLNKPPQSKKKKPVLRAPRRYDASVAQALQSVWEIANRPCGKRLVPFLPELVAALQRHGEIRWDQTLTEKILRLSPATADRLLKAARASCSVQGKTTTKPGTLLKHQIPVRTFSEWEDTRPGFVEADLVAHCSETARGDYLYTLTLTDVATQWTECLALRNRSQIAVSQAIATARKLLPFALLGLDSDNGAEFINHTLLRYCQEEKITFTRCRPYKKNDQCHVEQKNWSIVREHVGYDRLETENEWCLLGSLYASLRLYINFFQPCMKLTHKQRLGAKVKKQYDKAQTPYHRLLASGILTSAQADALKAQYQSLNPALLWRLLGKAKERLWKAAKVRNESEATNAP
jgi:hypothetical protein